MKYNTDTITDIQTAAEFLKLSQSFLQCQSGFLYIPGVFYQLKASSELDKGPDVLGVREPSRLAKALALFKSLVPTDETEDLTDGKKRIKAFSATEETAYYAEAVPHVTYKELVTKFTAEEFKSFVANGKKFLSKNEHMVLDCFLLKNGTGYACDGYRAYKKILDNDAVRDEILLNKRAAEAIAKTASGLISVYKQGSSVIYETDRYRFIDTPKEGSFPDIDFIFKPLAVSQEVETDDLREAAAFLDSAVTDQKKVVHFFKDRIETKNNSASDFSGMYFKTETAINLKYLIDAVSVFPKKSRIVSQHSEMPIDPIIFKSETEAVSTLPVRIKNNRVA